MKKRMGLCLIMVLVVSMLLSSASFAFSNIQVSKLSFSAATYSVDAGYSVKLPVTIQPANASSKVLTWRSSDTKIASVSSNGIVTGLKKGSVTISAKTSNGKITATCTVKVSNPVTVNLKWIIYGDMLEDSQSVWDEFNKKIGKVMPGTTVEISPIDGPSYDDKTRLIVASGEKYDIMWGASWKGDYAGKIAGGAFMPIKSLVDKTAPKLWDYIPSVEWATTSVNGQIYGVPSHQTIVATNGLNIVNKSYAQITSGVDMNALQKLLLDDKATVKQVYKAVEPLVAKAKKLNLGYPSVATTLRQAQRGYQQVAVAGVTFLTGIKLTENNYKVYSLLEEQGFKDEIALAREWQQKGYYPADLATFIKLPNSKINAPVSVGNFSLPLVQNFKRDEKLYGDGIWYKSMLLNKFYNNFGATSSANFISKKSKNSERAIRFLEVINSPEHSDIYNLLSFGIKDKHYKINSDNTVEVTSKNYKMRDWVVGNTDNSISNLINKELINANKDLIKKAPASPLNGFVFDINPVKSEYASVQTILTEYMDALSYGQYANYTTKYKEFISKLKAAGLDKIVQESQIQVTKWAKAQGKIK